MCKLHTIENVCGFFFLAVIRGVKKTKKTKTWDLLFLLFFTQQKCLLTSPYTI